MGRSSGSPPRGRGKGLGLAVNVLGDGIIPAWAGKSYCPATRSFGSWDHPRVGGEKPRNRGSLARSTGSPPRGRGKVLVVGIVLHRAGITPAWAGKSDSPPVCGWVWEDHPRVGGEKFSPRWKMANRPGSSPHGRGKDDTAVQLGARAGITPAWAGKSVSRRPRWTHTGDHPRVGGEKCVPVSWATGPAGSPPRRRGKVPQRRAPCCAAGITPA